MMKRIPYTNLMSFDNILYIGDEAKDCIEIIEKFSGRLKEIEQNYSGWFSNIDNELTINYKLQHHIQYHFEGGIAIFKFKNADDIPEVIRRECLVACKSLAIEQLFSAS
jgi:hypothetical protein